MTRLILRSDKDGDMTIDLKESRVLSLRLKVALQPHGIDLDTDKFQRMLEEDNHISSVLKFCGEVLYPEVITKQNEECSIESDYDDFFDDEDEYDPVLARPSLQGSKPISFADYCKRLSRMSTRELNEEGDIKMTTEDKLGMFTVHEKYSKGSVEVARGSRMSVFPRAQVRKKRYNRVSQIAIEAQRSHKTTKMLQNETASKQPASHSRNKV